MLRIRWDSYEKIIDISDSFQNFRDGKELLDMSLFCANGYDGSESLSAYMLLLAAYSPVVKYGLSHSTMNGSCV